MVRSIRAMAVAAGVAVLASASQAFIQDASILIDKALNSPVLTVKYKGASVSLVELKINGVSFNSRAVSPRDSNGETNFTLDTAALIDGENLVEVCLYDSTGKLVGTQKTRITADRRVESPVLLDGLKSGATVTGPVEIKVGLKRESTTSSRRSRISRPTATSGTRPASRTAGTTSKLGWSTRTIRPSRPRRPESS